MVGELFSKNHRRTQRTSSRGQTSRGKSGHLPRGTPAPHSHPAAGRGRPGHQLRDEPPAPAALPRRSHNRGHALGSPGQATGQMPLPSLLCRGHLPPDEGRGLRERAGGTQPTRPSPHPRWPRPLRRPLCQESSHEEARGRPGLTSGSESTAGHLGSGHGAPDLQTQHSVPGGPVPTRERQPRSALTRHGRAARAPRGWARAARRAGPWLGLPHAAPAPLDTESGVSLPRRLGWRRGGGGRADWRAPASPGR